jgi:hypothetical protein
MVSSGLMNLAKAGHVQVSSGPFLQMRLCGGGRPVLTLPGQGHADLTDRTKHGATCQPNTAYGKNLGRSFRLSDGEDQYRESEEKEPYHDHDPGKRQSNPGEGKTFL